MWWVLLSHRKVLSTFTRVFNSKLNWHTLSVLWAPVWNARYMHKYAGYCTKMRDEIQSSYLCNAGPDSASSSSAAAAAAAAAAATRFLTEMHMVFLFYFAWISSLPNIIIVLFPFFHWKQGIDKLRCHRWGCQLDDLLFFSARFTVRRLLMVIAITINTRWRPPCKVGSHIDL